jgi:hypothetical protein
MRFLVDAQLPRNLCTWLNGLEHDARHTLDLPLQNKTPDQQIVEIAERENRISGLERAKSCSNIETLFQIPSRIHRRWRSGCRV